ncbi:hypothetical protein RhiJN_26488 [Ceratobasidium sp. AG-Ba]|nr:hypothetical protein RhiJN_26488 [Ceratobasidium sp. AG-Ba]
MHLSKFFLVLVLALLHVVASAPTSDPGPAPSEPAPEPSEPPEPINPPPETTSRRETTPTPRVTSSSRAPPPPPPETSSTRETSSESTSTEPLESSTTLTDTFSETTTPSSTSASPSSTFASASSPVGGGQTCVQDCLAQAASSIGLLIQDAFAQGKSHLIHAGRHTHSWMHSSSFVSNARSCFTDENCDSAAASSAISDHTSVCDSLSTPSITSGTTPTSSRPPQPSITQTPVTRTPSPSRPPESTVSSVATFVIQSGAVITVSNSVYTAGGVVTTTFSGKMGDFAGGNGVTRLGANDAGATSIPNTGFALGVRIPVAGLTVVMGVVVGSLVCLAV